MTVSASEQIVSDPFRDQVKQKSCSNCSVSFTCGPAAGKGSCWCEELPHVSLVATADQDCLCPECLGQAISRPSHEGTNIPASIDSNTNSLPALIEGKDYYCEGSTIVFTAHYLLRRGYCCESGCRHCPYETARVNNRPISAQQ